MRVPFVPDFLFDSIYTIDIQRLKARGITLLLADLDNTLVPYSVKTPTEEVKAWRDRLQAEGITLFILSNSRKPGRAQRFAEGLEVPYQGHSGKPKAKGFYSAMERMGVNNAGVTTLMVKPIEFGTVFRLLRYGIETPFRTRGKGGGTL